MAANPPPPPPCLGIDEFVGADLPKSEANGSPKRSPTSEEGLFVVVVVGLIVGAGMEVPPQKRSSLPRFELPVDAEPPKRSSRRSAFEDEVGS